MMKGNISYPYMDHTRSALRNSFEDEHGVSLSPSTVMMHTVLWDRELLQINNGYLDEHSQARGAGLCVDCLCLARLALASYSDVLWLGCMTVCARLAALGSLRYSSLYRILSSLTHICPPVPSLIAECFCCG